MTYQRILLLNAVSLLEGVAIYLLLHHQWVICRIPGLETFIQVVGFVAVKNILVLGGYQLYFWSQTNDPQHPKTYLQPTALDRWIPAMPRMFWLYSPLYYFGFTLGILALHNFYVATLNAWLMLLHGAFWFSRFPTGITSDFRQGIRQVPTDRLTRWIMDLVHEYDAEENVLPSMHCAFAVYLSFAMYADYPTLAWAFPPLVAISCLTCKQHLLIDVVPGFLLGTLHAVLNSWMGGW